MHFHRNLGKYTNVGADNDLNQNYKPKIVGDVFE